MTPIRTFLAIPLPASLRDYLSKFPAQYINPQDKINWVKPENIHITLNYLGDTDSEVIEEQAKGLSELIGKYMPFELGTLDTGIFPHANDPRVLWVGSAPYNDSLGLLIPELNDHLKQLGYQLDNRKFQPHITIGRVKTISRKSTFIHDFLSSEVRDSSFLVDEIKWYKSTLTQQGAIYEELKIFKLKTGGQS